MDAQPARLRGQNALWKDSDVNVGICLKNWLNLFLSTSTNHDSTIVNYN